MSPYLCDIVVPLWNKLKITKDFVASITQNTTVSCRVILVNNGSEDGTPEYLRTLSDGDYVRFKVITNEKNEGFIKAVNRGLAVSKAPYVCMANNDLIFTPGWLEEIVNVFEKHPDVGLLNPNSNNMGLPQPKNVSLKKFSVDLKAKHSGVFVEHPFCIGFCMVLRQEVLTKVGGLSEEFMPMFFEDTDYSRRVHQSGFRLGVAKASYVWHMEHGSMSQLGADMEKIFVRSRDIYHKKWGPTWRVGWVVANTEDLLAHLNEGIALARQGHFVTFFVKGLKKGPQAIFADNGLIEMAGVQFKRYHTPMGVWGQIIVKKKKYHKIITKHKMLRFLLSAVGQTFYDDSHSLT